MGATGTYALPFQDDNDPPDGPALGEDLAEAVEDELIRIDADVATLDGRVDVLEAWTVEVYRSSDSASKTNNTFASDTQLVTPSLPASSTWLVEGWLWWASSSTTPDFKAQFIGPAGGDIVWSLVSIITSATSNSGAIDIGVQAGGFGTAHTRGTVNGSTAGLVKGYLTIAGTPGAVTVQWAQNTTDAAGVVMKAGSHLKLTRVA